MSRLSFTSLNILEGLEFTDCVLPDTIDFTHSSIKGNIILNPSRDGKIVTIIIDNAFPIKNFIWNFSKFDIWFERVPSERTEYFFREILEGQRKNGTTKDIEQADKMLKDYLVDQGNFVLGFQKFLWDYGYDKTLLLERMLFSFLFFFLINLILFKKLIQEVYAIGNLKVEYQKLSEYKNRNIKYARYPFIVFIYSCIIFFGWKMYIDKFPFRHLFLSFYLFIFYLIGLGLLFYVLGFC